MTSDTLRTACQTAADRPERQAVSPDPLEDLLDDPGLLVEDLVVGLAAAFVLADVAIPVRRGGQHMHAAAAGGVPLAPPAALQDLRPLVLRDHALHLQQQLLL